MNYEVHFFSKCSKFNVHFKNAIKSSENVFGSSEIAFELVAVNSSYYYENTSRWQSRCLNGFTNFEENEECVYLYI